MGLEAEAVLKGTTLKKLASQLILKNISQKALQFVTNSMPGLQEDPHVFDTDERINSGSNVRRPMISDNVDVQERIKVLWSMDPRPSQREIAKIINYPASSTKYQIKMMLEKGELEE